MSQASKPLFIPLVTRYYEAFESGEKTQELRPYGPRWNERTCAVGRAVVLSKGYGKQNRMIGRVVDFAKLPASELSECDKAAVMDVYGNLDLDIACVSIAELTPQLEA